MSNISFMSLDTKPGMNIRNVGVIDRTQRAVLALCILGYLLIYLDTMTAGFFALTVIATMVALTACCGWDPLYSSLGWQSDERYLAARLRGLRREHRIAIESEPGEVTSVAMPATEQQADEEPRRAA